MKFILRLLLVLLLTFELFHLSGECSAQVLPLKDTQPPKNQVQYGIASFYSDKFEGRKTSNGEIFRQQKMTAAHNTLPLGTYIRVVNLRNQRSVVVKVNDRLHHKNTRIVDLSRAAATKLGFIRSGTTRVRVEVLGKEPPELKKS
ncbi:MAG: septal ring lytic transglycosylase RlpA family protein [Bacteroidetes bacterium]|nr:septal ring lytic transglycosylase RlpA family protein [Bacteroidota bacterium]